MRHDILIFIVIIALFLLAGCAHMLPVCPEVKVSFCPAK